MGAIMEAYRKKSARAAMMRERGVRPPASMRPPPPPLSIWHGEDSISCPRLSPEQLVCACVCVARIAPTCSGHRAHQGCSGGRHRLV